ncbi:ABC transporter substrate-binding protein [Glutamicibacter sp. MNS18]|uniref:substrate-binding periplasmic protein n=1 Tax=Glutamicibacter sp. MNS18 TaxID=2989817 RepID=UPI002236B6B6|nr:ABC transporter substrate-binding protein [Glutamicibacter sp. MNS18]MCW4466802.1 ABC transporter substrate-binding protein [Glutamicibacter sp. MNS18]
MTRNAKNLGRGLLLTVIAATSLSACGASGSSTVPEDCTPVYEEFPTVAEGTLTVATYDFSPLTIIDGNELSGVEGDILNEISKRQCVTLTVDSAGGANAAIPSVQTGRADIPAGSWLRTQEREKIMRLGAPAYLSPNGVVSTKGLTAEELPGHKVGSVAGNLFNASLAEWLGNDFVIYQDDESIYGDLANGRIDALVAASISATARLEDNPVEGAQVIDVTPIEQVPEFAKSGQVNFPVSKDNEALGQTLDKLIIDMQEDGTIEQIVTKWNLDASTADVGEPNAL